MLNEPNICLPIISSSVSVVHHRVISDIPMIWLVGLTVSGKQDTVCLFRKAVLLPA